MSDGQVRPRTAAVIIIGNEILSGRTRDANLPFLARELAALGIRLREARVVPDEIDAVVEAVNSCRRRYDWVFTTGGIGPTHDDITARAIARAFGRPLVRHPEAERRLRAWYGEDALNAARLKMAEMPEGAELIDNPVSAAPGFRLSNVLVLAGIPEVARAMFTTLRPVLAGGPPMAARTLLVHAPEGDVAALLADIQRAFRDFEIGSYPFYRKGQVGTHAVFRGTDPARLEAARAALARRLEAAGIAFERWDGAEGA